VLPTHLLPALLGSAYVETGQQARRSCSHDATGHRLRTRSESGAGHVGRHHSVACTGSCVGKSWAYASLDQDQYTTALDYLGASRSFCPWPLAASVSYRPWD
jgi:hypothetical protein